jgi:glycosyltransferase involved in cell wall biosynthesis
MVRLLSIQPVAERGGSDQALLRMVRSLPPLEFECHLVLPGASPLRAEYEEAGATLHVVPMQRLSTSHGARDWARFMVTWPLVVTRLVRLIRRLDVGVVHTNSLHSLYGWAAAWLTRTPHVWHGREIVVQSQAALRLERFLARRFASRVICMSQAVADQLDPANVVVVRETVDPEEFSPHRAGRFRAAVGIPDTAPLAGTASRLDSWKGIDVLLDAYERAKRERPEIHAVIAGGPVAGKESLASGLAARAAALRDVHWVGPRTDMPALLADVDVFVLPSTEPEPYGLVAVEALASGARVIVSDAGGAPEIIERAPSDSGVRVPPRDVEALASAIAVLLPSATSTNTRAERESRQPSSEMSRFADIFRAVAASWGGRRRGRARQGSC